MLANFWGDTLETYDFKKLINWLFHNLHGIDKEDVCGFELLPFEYDDGITYDAFFWTTKGKFTVGTLSDGFLKDLVNLPYFMEENNILFFDIFAIRMLIDD